MYQYFPCGLCLCFFLWSRLCPLMYPKSFIILLFIFRSVTRMTISPSVLRAVLVSTCCLRIIIHSVLFLLYNKVSRFEGKLYNQSIQFSSVAQLCLTLQAYGLQHTRLPCPSPTPGAYSKTHVHRVSDAIQPSHPLSSPSAFSLSYHQGLFQGVSSSHQVAKVLEFQLQYQSFQWIFRTDLL